MYTTLQLYKPTYQVLYTTLQNSTTPANLDNTKTLQNFTNFEDYTLHNTLFFNTTLHNIAQKTVQQFYTTLTKYKTLPNSYMFMHNVSKLSKTTQTLTQHYTTLQH